MTIQVIPSATFKNKFGLDCIKNNEYAKWYFKLDTETTVMFEGPYLVAVQQARLTFKRDKQASYGQILIVNKEEVN